MQKHSAFIMSGLAGLGMSCQEQAKKMPEKPNIIFIMSDDHAYQAISAYGSVLNQTPNIDRLAQEGMLFEQAFVTNSICSPSRAVILTGKYSHLNGVIDNRLPFDTSQVTFPKILREHGYQTAMIGKWHLKTEPSGFDFWRVLPGQGDYYNPEFKTREGTRQYEGYVSDIITGFALEWLEKRDPDKPFMMIYQHKAPHREWYPGPGHLGYGFDKEFPEPVTFFDDYSTRGSAAREQEMTLLYDMKPSNDNKLDTISALGITGTNAWGRRNYARHMKRFTGEQKRAWDSVYDPVIEEFNKQLPEGRELQRWKYQRYMQDYLGCIQSVDDNVGRLLDYLEKNDLAENTIVFYTSDQGFYLGEHGWFDKRFMYEESFRTPLLVRWPGVVEEGTKTDAMVLNLDIPETILEIAGAEIPAEMQGVSFLPILKGEEPEDWRDAVYYHYYEYPSVHMVKRHYGIRTDRYKLIHFYYDVDEWELYDLEADPHEVNNIYGEPGTEEITKDLKEQLRNLREQFGDTDEVTRSFLPEALQLAE